jgi:hypothetical protein
MLELEEVEACILGKQEEISYQQQDDDYEEHKMDSASEKESSTN